MFDPYKFTSRTSIGKLGRLPLGLIPRGLDIPVLSGPNKGLRWRAGSSVHGCWAGTYEHAKIEFFSRFVKPGMVAYDIGANAGYYSLLLSRLVGPSGSVFAFEPFPENLVNLLHHVAVNKLANCQVIAAAVSDRTGVSGFRVGTSNSMGSLAERGASLHVPTISLDDAVGRLGIPRPDLVKMDVEGAEGLVLAGAKSALSARTCVWFAALHGEQPARTSVSILRDSGYCVRDLSGNEVSEASVALVDEIYATGEVSSNPEALASTPVRPG